MFKRLLEFIPFLSRDGEKPEKFQKATFTKTCFYDSSAEEKRKLRKLLLRFKKLGPYPLLNENKETEEVTITDSGGRKHTIPRKFVTIH